MAKTQVVLIVLNKNRLGNALECLNFNNVALVGVLVEGGDRRVIPINNTNVPMFSFSAMDAILKQARNALWLISGFVNNVADIYKTKKFLMAGGVPEGNIVNFEILTHITEAWIANIRFVEQNAVDYFVTGISYHEAGFNINCISGMKGINLASSNQDLRQGYLTAKYVFEHAKPGTIKFVFIGLTPYSLRYDNIEAFSVCTRNLQYIFTLNNSKDDSTHGKLLQLLVSDKIKNIFSTVDATKADLNFDRVKNSVSKEFPVNALVTWEDELKNLTKAPYPKTVKKNLQILEDYIKLCLDNGAKPVGVMFPFALAMHDNYSNELLSSFRRAINKLTKKYDEFNFIDLFDLPLDYRHFYNMAHLNLLGSLTATSVLNLRLCKNNILPKENLCRMNYSELNRMVGILDKNSYNDLANSIFKATAEKIRQKDKVRVGFVLLDASMWCGNGIYNLFAQNERYEPTVFLCLRQDDRVNENVTKDFHHGVEQFKAEGLNIVGVKDNSIDIPKQDVLIFLTPYVEVLPKAFVFQTLTAETLLTYIPYGFSISAYNINDFPIMHCIWKSFFETKLSLEDADKKCRVGMPRGYVSGYPKLDVFFDSKADSKFEWKMARPNAVKIIYAPHWSMHDGVKYSTFHYNYQFMYEYAKAHPEISWVFKPHPHLLYTAVKSYSKVDKELFPSVEAFKEYLQKWDDLPNAKVVTGAYYQDIFATSDGMILDSGSFICEYQYTHKPMIFLTRETQRFNGLVDELMKVLYRVAGRDFEGMEKLMQKVFIDGNDDMFDARMKFFDKYFDYRKYNGMSASEYIFRSITGELE